MRKYIILIKNIGLFTLSNLAAKLISFIFLPIYTAYLTTEEYGVIDMANVMQGLLWPIISLSIAEALLRFALDVKNDKKKVISSALVLILPGLVLLTVVFPCINTGTVLDQYKLECLVYFICVSLNTFLGVYARAVDRVKLMVINSTVSCFSIAALNVVFLSILHMRAEGYFLALIIGNMISVISYLIFGKVHEIFSIRYVDLILCKQMLLFSVPLIPNAVFWWVNSSLDRIYLTSMLSLAEVGLYAVAGKIPTLLTTVTSIFQQAWSISAIKEIDSEDRSTFFSNIFNVYSFLVAICSVTLIVASKILAFLLFSNEFFEAWYIVPILVFAFYYSSLNIYYGSIFTAAKNTKIIFVTTGLGAVVNIVLNYFMILIFGLIGAAIATCVSNGMVWLIRAVTSRRLVPLNSSIFKEIVQQLIIFFAIINIETVNNPVIAIGVICLMILVFRDTIKQVVDTVKNKMVRKNNE